MLRRFAFAATLFAITCTFAFGDYTLKATKVKIADGKATITGYKGTFDKDAKKFEWGKDTVDVTLPADIVVEKGGKKGAAGEKVETGLKDAMFTDINAETGVILNVKEEDGKATKIMVRGGKKKKDAQ